jgi:hypothetical protein
MQRAEDGKSWATKQPIAPSAPLTTSSRPSSAWTGHQITFLSWGKWEWQNILALVIAVAFLAFLNRIRDDTRDWHYPARARRWVMFLLVVSWWMELVYRFWYPIFKRWRDEQEATEAGL